MSSPVITVEGLAKKYRLGVARQETLRDRITQVFRQVRSLKGAKPAREDFWALRDISFEVQRGEVLGIIGRNGAGKSTLLKVLSRITEPTNGKVTIRGRVASLLEVGTGFHPELSGRENVFLNGAILGMSRAEIRRKFDEIVAFAEVERFLDTPVKHYSSGMYVRLAFAVAAHLEPEILIVDEVLAVGDMAFQEKCLGKMESVAKQEGRTVLFVSHNISAVAAFCSRGLLLDAGAVRLDGTTAAAIEGYLQSRSGGAARGTAFSAPRPESGSPLEITGVSLNHGTPVTHREPLVVSIRFRTRTGLPGAGFGIGFCSLDGRRILTCDSDYAGSFLPVPAAGEYEARLSIPVLDLVPTRYRLDVAAFSNTRALHHYAPDCMLVDVQPGARTPPYMNGLQGEVRPPADWQVSTLP